jgi:protein-S-isoprenylcysteine O-methyltransferase Ste14
MEQQPKDAPGVITFPALLLLVALALGVGAHFLFPLPVFPHAVVRVLGGILAVIAAIIAGSARAQMLKAGTNVLPTLPTTAIVASGPYRFTRNPMYLALCLLNLGVGLLLCDVTPIVLTFVLAAVLHWGVILREERYLERKFGGLYSDYKDRVRRWL